MENVKNSNPRIRIIQDELEWDGDLRILNDQPFSGIAFQIFPDGTLEEEIEFEAGWPTGCSMTWYESGEVRSESRRTPGSPLALSQEWYQNGQLRSLTCRERGIVTRTERWNEQGVLVSTQKIQESDPEYPRLVSLRAKDSAGLDSEQSPFENSNVVKKHLPRIESSQVVFNESGACFNGTVFSGTLTSIDALKNLNSETDYRDGFVHGLSRTYFRDGQVSSELFWKKTSSTSRLTRFFRDGRVEDVVYFEFGIQVSRNRWSGTGSQKECSEISPLSPEFARLEAARKAGHPETNPDHLKVCLDFLKELRRG